MNSALLSVDSGFDESNRPTLSNTSHIIVNVKGFTESLRCFESFMNISGTNIRDHCGAYRQSAHRDGLINVQTSDIPAIIHVMCARMSLRASRESHVTNEINRYEQGTVVPWSKMTFRIAPNVETWGIYVWSMFPFGPNVSMICSAGVFLPRPNLYRSHSSRASVASRT